MFTLELQSEVCMQVPEPDGVEHFDCVQHLISLDPGHKFDVVVPEQHPAEILTQAPSYPDTVQVAEYEHTPDSKDVPLSFSNDKPVQITLNKITRR